MSRSSLIDTVLGQRYQLRRRIGVGGMGTVYEAEQLDEGRSVAVKVLQQHLIGVPAVHARFRREAQATAEVKHPHIVEVMDFHDGPDEPPFLVMELLQGQTLKSLLKKEGPLPVARAATIARQVASALAAAHEAGVIHRDIKPDNIFLVDTGTADIQVKVLDFGVARLMHEDDATALGTESGAWVGTPSYMAPEQVRCRPVDGRADIYSLGACLYQMMTGRRPIDVADNVALLSAILVQVPTPLSGVRSEVPEGFSLVVERTLMKDPAERFENARALAQALEPWTHAAPIPAPARPVAELAAVAATKEAPASEAAPSDVTPPPARLQTLLMVGGALGVGLATTGGLVFAASNMTPADERALIRVVEAPRLTGEGSGAPPPHGYSEGWIAESIEAHAPALARCYARVGEDTTCRQDTYALDYSADGVVLEARTPPQQPLALARCVDKVLRGISLGSPREAAPGTLTVLLRRE